MNAGAPYRGNAFIGGAVFFFLRELRWGTPYRVETKAVAVDDKWLYMESRWYVEGSPARGAKAVALAAAAPSSASASAASASSASASAAPDAAAALPAEPRAGAADAAATDVLATVQITRFVFKEGSGPLRGKTIPPREAFRDLGLSVPAGFAAALRIGAFFTEAFEITTSSESGLRQEGDCGC